jgi:hypothetical protein
MVSSRDFNVARCTTTSIRNQCPVLDSMFTPGGFLMLVPRVRLLSNWFNQAVASTGTIRNLVIQQQTSTHDIEHLWSRSFCARWCGKQSFLRTDPNTLRKFFGIKILASSDGVCRWRMGSSWLSPWCLN